ncbi:MAG: hypothetical protein R2788_25315 [Saprospiraceae bacterium]
MDGELLYRKWSPKQYVLYHLDNIVYKRTYQFGSAESPEVNEAFSAIADFDKGLTLSSEDSGFCLLKFPYRYLIVCSKVEALYSNIK